MRIGECLGIIFPLFLHVRITELRSRRKTDDMTIHSGTGTLILAAYLVPAVIAMVYSLNLYTLLILWAARRREAKRERTRLGQFPKEHWIHNAPAVLTQIPVYNESTVVERVMRAVAAIHYPAGKHTIQILDDSNDETCATIDRVAAELKAAGHRIEVVRRPERVGYKAGALQYGMRDHTEPVIAIFDADFIPPPDFLERTVPILIQRPELGLVQARWGHLNTDDSAVTQVNAIVLDGHFVVDQGARAFNGLFMNFNGTAGIWRRQAILDGGGWEYDTLNEDMDLSYRSQMAGWKCFFLPDLVVPSELPDNINTFKIQQTRWAKGAIQVAIKLLPRIFRSKVSPLAKIQAFFHLTGYAAHPLVVVMAIMSLPLAIITAGPIFPSWIQSFTWLFVLGAMAPSLMYSTAQVVLHKGRGWKSLLWMPVLTLLGVGIAVTITRGVMEALFGKPSEFTRTPKRGTGGGARYRSPLTGITLLELAFAAYCAFAIYEMSDAPVACGWPFLSIYALAFFTVGTMSLAHALSGGADAKQTAAGPGSEYLAARS